MKMRISINNLGLLNIINKTNDIIVTGGNFNVCIENQIVGHLIGGYSYVSNIEQ